MWNLRDPDRDLWRRGALRRSRRPKARTITYVVSLLGLLVSSRLGSLGEAPACKRLTGRPVRQLTVSWEPMS